MADRSDRPIDLLVFGATGFTGERVLMEVAHQAVREGWTYGIAGRSDRRLQSTATKIGALLQISDVEKAPVLVCNVHDQDSLVRAFSMARVVINCVGPYRYYGSQVVDACVAAKADYVDVTGEPQFMDSSALNFSTAAEQAGVAIVHACGFDSIPAELGAQYCALEFANKFPGGKLNSVESYIQFKGHPRFGFGIHYATYESAVQGFGDVASLKTVRKQLAKQPHRQARVERLAQPVRLVNKVRFNPTFRAYTYPFLGADSAVVRNSQQLLAGAVGETEPQPYFCAYVLISSYVNVVRLMLVGFVFTVLARFNMGRKLLLALPGFFTGGLVSHAGPSEEQMRSTRAIMNFQARGYRNTSTVDANNQVKPDVTLACVWEMPEPGYIATPIYVVAAARTMLKERAAIAGGKVTGGVFTPGVAFKHTTLLTRLQADERLQMSARVQQS